MENLNGHEAGNGGHSQGDTYGNSPSLDPTFLNASAKHYMFILRGLMEVEDALRKKNIPFYQVTLNIF
jgi:deoxyribodipyrimidine photolyase